MAPPKINKYGAFDGPFDQAVLDEFTDRRDNLVERRDAIGDLLNDEAVGKDTSIKDITLHQTRGMDWARLDQQIKELDADIEAYKLKDEVELKTTEMSDDMHLFRQYLTRNENPATLLKADDFSNNREEAESPTPDGIAPGLSFVYRMPGWEDARSMTYRRAVMLLQANGMLPNDFKMATAGVTASDNATGQEAVLEQIVPSLIERLSNFGDLSKFVHKFMTRTGGDFIIPQHDGHDHIGETLSAQGVDITTLQQDNITKILMRMNTISSKKVSITKEMLQDAVFNVALWAEKALARRIGRRVNRSATRGEANTEWEGLTEKLIPGVTTALSGGVAYTELIDLIYSINAAYRLGGEQGEGGLMDIVRDGVGDATGKVGFMMHDSFVKLLMKMTDGDSRPLWLPSTRDGAPSRILGYEYGTNDDLEEVAAGAVPCVFGSFDHFFLREAAEVQVYRFWDSQTAVSNEVQFMAFCRRASKHAGPLDGNGNNEALAKLTMHA